jgi:ClpP class serine protease
LSAAVKADLQREVDAAYHGFVKSVADNRPGLTQAAVRATQARVFTGRAAVAAGLADAVGSFADAVDMAARLARGERVGLPSAQSAIPAADYSKLGVTAGAAALLAQGLAGLPPANKQENVMPATATSSTPNIEAAQIYRDRKAATGNSWDSVVATLNAEHARNRGVACSPAATNSAERSSQAGARPWAEIWAEINGAQSRKTSAGAIDAASIYADRRKTVEAARQPAGAEGDHGWGAIAAKLNREAGLDAPAVYARRREAVR